MAALVFASASVYTFPSADAKELPYAELSYDPSITWLYDTIAPPAVVVILKEISADSPSLSVIVKVQRSIPAAGYANDSSVILKASVVLKVESSAVNGVLLNVLTTFRFLSFALELEFENALIPT